MADPATNGAPQKIRIIGFVCERAYDLDKIMNQSDGTLKADPDVRLITLPCSGMVQPGFIEKALDSGAQGAFVMGCVLGDCYFRDGNYIIQERIDGTRRPMVKKKYNREQIGSLWFSRAMKTEELLGTIAQFKDRVVTFCRENPDKLPAAKAKHTPRPTAAAQAAHAARAKE
ncbi:MAG TPA: hydrogenase iron-sulfur subunit [bacterium]|nr:hydrogenase iron-sulfur subunit [bacterium]